MKVAALFVQVPGVYTGRVDVDAWGLERDARRYRGVLPVVAHPPCGAWGVYARCGWTTRALGDDDGCFASALANVERCGGVLEHPAHSSAWKAHGIGRPSRDGWRQADDRGGWTCAVEQGHYGSRCRKPTWLYAWSAHEPAPLVWGASETEVGYRTLGKRARSATPPAFAEALLAIARDSRR